MIDIAFVISFAFIGTILGCITGLVPGFHVNNLALLLLSASPSILAFLSPCGELASLLVGAMVVSASIAHTFVNIIPSTFIGAPEEDTALVLLPAHSMLLEGRGYGAISLSAVGSFGAAVMAFLFVVPFRFTLCSPLNLYWVIRRIIPWILLAITLILVLTEKSGKHIVYAALIFSLSGIFGMEILHMNSHSIVGMEVSLLFPALAGLFGVPTLLHSFSSPSLPEQIIEEETAPGSWKDIAAGTVSGAFVSILPGVTSAVATIMAMVARRKSDRKNVIVTLSSVNTATSFFVLVVLFMVERARSGSAIVLGELMDVERWSGTLPPQSLCYLMISVIVSAIVSYHATKFLGRIIATHISRISYGTIAKSSVALISAMVLAFTGLTGIVVLITGTLIGMLCLELRVRRSLGMGVLILPIMLTYFL